MLMKLKKKKDRHVTITQYFHYNEADSLFPSFVIPVLDLSNLL